jgi:hypothetical protein
MIYIGCTIKPVGNWQSILPAPTAPANYKDQKKIDAYIQAKLQELMSTGAATHPLSGSIDEAVVLSGADEVLKFKNGVELLDKLAEATELTAFVGYKIYRNLRLAATEYIVAKGHLPVTLHWIYDPKAYGLHATPSHAYFDPVSTIFGTSDEDKIDPLGVARRLGIEADLSNALGLAWFGRNVASRLLPE